MGETAKDYMERSSEGVGMTPRQEKPLLAYDVMVQGTVIQIQAHGYHVKDGLLEFWVWRDNSRVPTAAFASWRHVIEESDDPKDEA